MSTLNYTTSIAATQSVGEVSGLLAKRKVASIATRYDEDGRAVGIAFTLRTPHGPRSFDLDVNISGVHQLLIEDEKAGRFRTARKAAGTFSSLDHAERVAWRITKDWLEAQLALVDARMATLDQVMLPYLVVRPDGQTLHDAYLANEARILEAGSAL